jgi:hypothetical protein
MPALSREEMFQHIGMVYFNSRSLNQQTTLERSFERLYGDLEGLGVTTSPAAHPAPTNAPTPPPRQQRASPAQTPAQTPAPAPRRNRTSLTQRITEALTNTPGGMTLAQIARRVNSQQLTVTRTLTQQVTTGSYVKEANKYRISTTAPGAAAPAAGTQPAAAQSAPRSPRPRARARSSTGETATDRVVNLVVQRPGITKAEVITAMAPARPNHVGIWLARMCKSNRITGSQSGKEGPYYPTSTSQRAAA